MAVFPVRTHGMASNRKTIQMIKKLVSATAFLCLLVIVYKSYGINTILTDIMYDGDGHRFSKSYRYLEEVLADCGELCNTTRKGTEGPYFNHVRAKVQCDRLFMNEHIDKEHRQEHAPKIPAELRAAYTMDGRVKLRKWFFDMPKVQYLGTKVNIPIWTKDFIESMVKSARQGLLKGTYGIKSTNALRDGLSHSPAIKDGRVLVIGTEKPWVEACLIEAGAREVVTLEYRKIISQHPLIKTMEPLEFRSEYLHGILGMFDGIVTYSSVEHSGLGKYGDALNPWGDIIAIARAWCVTRDGGSLVIGVPYKRGNDSLYFNAHRVYGKLRYPFLTTNWHQEYEGFGNQRVYVLKKTLK